jgi:hypothetical protein
MGNMMRDVLIPVDLDELELFDIGPPPKPDTSESSNGGEDRSMADAAKNAVDSRQPIPMVSADDASPNDENVGDPLPRAESLHRRAANRARIEPFPAMNNIPSIAELLMLDEVDDDWQRSTFVKRIVPHHPVIS